MESIRQQKVARLLQKELGEIFSKNLVSTPTGVMLSITQIRMSPDLGVAKVYLSLFPSENKGEALDFIRKHTSEIRYVLGKRLGKQLRHIPELVFFLDDSFDYAEEIDQLLS